MKATQSFAQDRGTGATPAIATELSDHALKVNPFVPIALLWIGAFMRDRSIFF
jgi:hypothetical protein